METAAPWKPWKTQKAGFPPFPPRLENSPQKTRSEFSTVPTASAANILSLKRETVSSRRCSCSRTWFAIAISPVHRKQAGRPAISLTRRSRESLCLTSPFIERGQPDFSHSLWSWWCYDFQTVSALAVFERFTDCVGDIQEFPLILF